MSSNSRSVSPEYDEDMATAEWYIRVRSGEEDPEALYLHFKGVALHYFNILEKFIFQGEATFVYDRFYYMTEQPHFSESLNLKILNEDENINLSKEDEKLFKISRSHQNTRKKYIRDNFAMYKKYFREILSKLEGDEYNVRKVIAPFLFTASLACLNIFPPLEVNDNIANLLGLTLRPQNIFPLVNHTGEFSLNTYMYALLNHVEMLGIPSGETSFDGTQGCPATFLRHDAQHTTKMMSSVFRFMPIDYIREEVYYPMLDKTEDYLLKELLVFVLWISVHEAYVPVFKKVDSNFQTLNYFSDIFKYIYNNFHLFLDAITKFEPLITKEDEKMITGVFLEAYSQGPTLKFIMANKISKDSDERDKYNMAMPSVFVFCKGLVYITDEILGWKIGDIGRKSPKRNINLITK